MRTMQTALLIFAIVVTGHACAGSLIVPHGFSPNTAAKASEVNANFTAVELAVGDNDTRITTLESVNADSRLTSLESNAANPNVTGNITVPESTDAAHGSLMKGSIPFLHNYGTHNTFVGEYAGNFTMAGSNNTASGFESLSGNTDGAGNTAGGFRALYANTTGNGNTATGIQALYNNTGGGDNTATGTFSLYTNTSGNNNTATGSYALAQNSDGSGNTANGFYALWSNTQGASNTAVGYNALNGNTTGSYNIAIGNGAGSSLTTGNFNIAIGNQGIAGESNTMRLGGSQNRTFITGIRGITTGVADATTVVIDSNGQLGTVSSSRQVKDHVQTMGDASEVLNKLHPVTFYYKSDHDPKGRHLQYGLVAEDVAKATPSLVSYDKDGKVSGVYYRFLAPMLLNEYQKQRRVIAAQDALLKQQAARIAKLETQITAVAELERRVERLSSVLASRQQPQRIVAANGP